LIILRELDARRRSVGEKGRDDNVLRTIDEFVAGLVGPTIAERIRAVGQLGRHDVASMRVRRAEIEEERLAAIRDEIAAEVGERDRIAAAAGVPLDDDLEWINRFRSDVILARASGAVAVLGKDRRKTADRAEGRKM